MHLTTVSHASYNERIALKTREAVKKADPCDWYTLAISAAKCLKKEVNLDEASIWLDRSLKIEETPFNLELKGDYYIYNSMPDKAIEYYVRAMNTLKQKNGNSNISNLQKKVANIINIGA